MKKLKVYYAHFMGIYNTPQEERDVKTLEALGLEVLNPNTPEVSAEFAAEKTGSYEAKFDKVFGTKVRECEVFAFKALPDGRIPGGIAMELKYATAAGKIIIELPSGTYARMMGRDDTREYLRDIGQR
jgi:hypothetical protein